MGASSSADEPNGNSEPVEESAGRVRATGPGARSLCARSFCARSFCARWLCLCGAAFAGERR